MTFKESNKPFMAEKHENPLWQFLEVYGYRKKKRIIIPEGIGFQAG